MAKSTTSPEKQVVQGQMEIATVAVASAIMRLLAPPAITKELAKSASLNLDTPATLVKGLMLRANIPTVVTLQGAPDLRFGAFTVQLTAKELVRDMARSEWGTAEASVTKPQTGQQYLLPGLSRIDGITFSGGSRSQVSIFYRENGAYPTGAQIGLSPTTSGGVHTASLVTAFQTDALLLQAAATGETLTIHSISLPSRVGVSVGDDSPVQVFPSAMEAGGQVVTRDLAQQLNAAWGRATPVGGVVQVPLKLTSQTDGMVDLLLGGRWSRLFVGPEVDLLLDPVQVASLAVPWPFGTAKATVRLVLTGSLSGGRRLNLVAEQSTFAVRVREQLEVAMAVLLAPGGPTGEARQVTAIWLMLPAVPQAEERIELRLAAGEGDPLYPADPPLAQVEVSLPADAAAYVADGAGYWFRAELEQPVEVDGAAAGRPLFLVAGGRGDGTLLCHGYGKELPQEVALAGAVRPPAGPGQAGLALVRNMGRTGSWELQPFNQQGARWLADLELAPLGAEYAGLVRVAMAGLAERAAGFAGPGRARVEEVWDEVAPPTGGELRTQVRSAVAGRLKGQLTVERVVK